MIAERGRFICRRDSLDLRKAVLIMINVCDIQVMKPLLAEHGFHFSKAKGQNFLIAPWVPQSIAEEAGVD